MKELFLLCFTLVLQQNNSISKVLLSREGAAKPWKIIKYLEKNDGIWSCSFILSRTNGLKMNNCENNLNKVKTNQIFYVIWKKVYYIYYVSSEVLHI